MNEVEAAAGFRVEMQKSGFDYIHKHLNIINSLSMCLYALHCYDFVFEMSKGQFMDSFLRKHFSQLSGYNLCRAQQ